VSNEAGMVEVRSVMMVREVPFIARATASVREWGSGWEND